MSTLELFPNLSIYRLQTKDEIVDLPVGVSDIVAIDKTTFDSVPTRLIRNSPFEPGDQIQIDDLQGQLIQTTDTYTDLYLDNSADSTPTLIRVYSVSQIISLGSVSKRYQISNPEQNDVVITGFDEHLSWSPTYTVILSKDPNLIRKLSLIGQVNASQTNYLGFNIDEIVFNTKSVLRQSGPKLMSSSMARSAVMSQEDAVEDLDEENINFESRYTWSDPIEISDEMTFPLASWDNLTSKRVYFLGIRQNSKPVYGYVFEIQSFIPSGPVRVQDDELNFVGMTTLQNVGTGKRVTLKIAVEDNLLTQTIVQNRSQIEDTESDNETKVHTEITDFEITVFSKFKTDVRLIAELDFSGTLKSASKEPDERLPGKLLWYHTVKPGKNVFKGWVEYYY